MILAKDEELLKEWDYATSTFKSVKTTHSLVITNKRIVSKSVNKRQNLHQEIAIKDVKSFSCGHATPSLKDAIIFMVLGALLMIASVFLFFKTDIGPYILLGCVFGLIFIIMGIRRLGQGVFALVINTKHADHESMGLGAMQVYKTVFKPLFSGKLKVTVNNEVVEEIVEVLGSLVF